MTQFLSSLKPSKFPIFLRADLNVSLKNGEIKKTDLIKRSIPTINHLFQKTDTIIMCTHLGEPDTLRKDFSLSTKLLQEPLSQYLEKKIHFIENIHNYGELVKAPGIYLLENVRFYTEELSNDSVFAQQLLGPCKTYVNDAYAYAHFAHASMDAITRYVPAYAGLLFEKELAIRRSNCI